MHTRVVHWKKASYDIYIGRVRGSLLHYGNPFSHLDNSAAEAKVATREEAILAYEAWLKGEQWQQVSPRRRRWILKMIPTLKDKVLGCWCSPLDCHGEVLAEMADDS